MLNKCLLVKGRKEGGRDRRREGREGMREGERKGRGIQRRGVGQWGNCIKGMKKTT